MVHGFLSRMSGYTFIPLDDFEPRSAHHDDLRATLQAYALQTYGEAGPPAREVARGARAAVMEVMARGGNVQPVEPVARLGPGDGVD